MEGKFCCLKLLREPLNTNIHEKKNYSKIYDEPDRLEGAGFELNHCREEDLIVISKYRINLEGQDDIKMVSGGTKFLREVLSKNGVMLGFVSKCNTKSDNFVEIWVDGKKAKYFQRADDEEGGAVHTRYFYHFESLLTSIREFKALKALEFTRLSPMLTYPTLSLEYKDRMLEQYSKVIDTAFKENSEKPDMYPKTSIKDEERNQYLMNHYLLSNH